MEFPTPLVPATLIRRYKRFLSDCRLSDGHFTGVDTSLPNRMLKAALDAREVPALAGYAQVRPEVKYGEKSRIDFLLSADGLPDAYVEVKSVTLCRRPGAAEFPDATTARGARHMHELGLMARAGFRAVVLFLVQRTDASEVRIADDIDPAYAKALMEAYGAGVEVIAHGTNISPRGVTLGPALPVTLPVP